MTRAIAYMFTSFFVGTLISEADPWCGLFLFFVHILNRWEDARRCCKGHSEGSARSEKEKRYQSKETVLSMRALYRQPRREMILFLLGSRPSSVAMVPVNYFKHVLQSLSNSKTQVFST
jgi:hypothetical protein